MNTKRFYTLFIACAFCVGCTQPCVVTWTEGENKDVYRRLWALGFDHFTTDYPDTLFALLPEFAAGK